MRSTAATVVGWIIVAIVAWILLGWIFGAIRFLIRSILVIVVVIALISLYARLSEN